VLPADWAKTAGARARAANQAVIEFLSWVFGYFFRIGSMTAAMSWSP